VRVENRCRRIKRFEGLKRVLASRLIVLELDVFDRCTVQSREAVLRVKRGEEREISQFSDRISLES